MNKNYISKLAAALAAVTTLITAGTAIAGGHDHRGIDYDRLDRASSAVEDSAHALTCSFEREMRSHRGHGHSSNDSRILGYLKEIERRVGHVHKAIHTHCSLPTVKMRASYAHKTADSMRSKIRHAGGLSHNLESAFDSLHRDIVALEKSVEHADHGHAQVTREDEHGHSDNSRDRGRSDDRNRGYSERSRSGYGYREASASPSARTSTRIPFGRSGIVLNFGRN